MLKGSLINAERLCLKLEGQSNIPGNLGGLNHALSTSRAIEKQPSQTGFWLLLPPPPLFKLAEVICRCRPLHLGGGSFWQGCSEAI